MRNLALIFLVSILLSACQQDELRIPRGNEPLFNSLIGADEWTGSKIYEVNDSLRLRMHQDDSSIYIAVDFDEIDLDQYRWVELYVFDNASMQRFHASGQLGEQTFRLPYWTQNWDWGNNELWFATTQRLAGEERKSSSNQAYEFKFAKKKFQGQELSIFMHSFTISTQADFSAAPLEYVYPLEADRYHPETWANFRY